MIAAWLPARSASRVDPVQALQKGKYQVLTAGENRARRFTAAGLMVAAAALSLGGPIVVVLRRLRADYCRRAAGGADRFSVVRQSPAAGLEMAPAGRRRARGRQPHSIAAPDIGCGGCADAVAGQVIGLGGVGRESYNSIVDWLDTALNPDLFVCRIAESVGSHVSVSYALTSDIAAIEGWLTCRPVRSLRIECRGHSRHADCRRYGELRAPGPAADRRRRPSRNVQRSPGPAKASSSRTTSQG